MMPPLVASTMRSRSDGVPASTRPSASSHDPKPLPPQSRPYTSEVSMRFMPRSSAVEINAVLWESDELVNRQQPKPIGPISTSSPRRRMASDTRLSSMASG
jgi:hypothetical protein